ncbi:MAG: NirA family protein [Bradyrhizobium sp.]|nr:NirA family protein [Bradyrhizobium sp.]MBV9561970.1 NirA family protein [Bradyrhizobium sp.]
MALDQGFTDEQKQYLEGFITAIANKRGITVPNGAASRGPANQANPYAADPMAIHYEAQDRTIAAGGKLVPEEVAKREKHPFDIWDEIAANAVAGRFPKGLDIFRHKFHGLFYVAPNQDAFMLRLRLPGGIVRADQARGLADVAERFGGGYVDITTRANLQIREIGASHPLEVLEAIDELGLTSRGSGADNIRNLTGSPAAGVDPQELYDTRPLCRALYHLILNHRELYGLPRKFNIAFDGGGKLSVLEDTNDIGFTAVSVGPGKEVPEGVYFRMALGGLTGHMAFAADAGVLLKPEEVVPAAVAIVKAFIANGDRTDRHKARMKYLIDRWGIPKLVEEAAAYLPFPWRHAALEINEPRGPIERYGHIGVHEQAQPGLSYVGVVFPVGRVTSAQLRGLAGIAERCGSGTLRLTVWQNLLISDIPQADVAAATAEIEALGLGIKASAIRGGLVACTGNVGCKFALANTKRHALALADHLDARVVLDTPLNIHLTGCPNSCAQHIVGDIGLLATKVDAGGDDEIEGYHLHVGGGAGAEQRLGREIVQSIPAEEVPMRVEALLRAYLAHRRDDESFYAFAGRHSDAELRAMLTPVSRAA